MSNRKIFNKFNTLRWVNGTLEMLDQRALPARVEYLRYDSAASVAEGIRAMVVRGAPAIGAPRLMGSRWKRCAYSTIHAIRFSQASRTA
jgi:methylthioribose-1-phosphate isomerase